jgi:DNA polymerase-3 subunit alpha
MGKKKAAEMDRQKELFLHGNGENIEGAKNRGYDMAKAEDLFDKLAKFAGYGFNKSHSAAYALIAYQTAYLKANFPVEYMAGILSCELEKTEKIVIFTEECKSMGIEVHPPDINKSGTSFVIDGNTIRFGLGAIKNVGINAIESALEVRKADGEFKNIYDFCERVDLRACNRKVLESLIKAGAFDSTGINRRQNLQVLENALEEGQRKQKMSSQGIISIEAFLSDGEDDEEDEYFFPDVPEMPENELLKLEKEVLDFYISNHPLAVYNDVLKTFTVPMRELASPDAEPQCVVGGLVKTVKQIMTKKGDKMAFITLEDMDTEMEVVVFPRTFADYSHLIEADKIVIIAGKLNHKEGKVSILADDIMEVSDAMGKLTANITVKLSSIGMTDERIAKLKQIISENRGEVPLNILLEKPNSCDVLISTGADFSVKPEYEFYYELDSLLGKGRYEIKPRSYVHKEEKKKYYKKGNAS